MESSYLPNGIFISSKWNLHIFQMESSYLRIFQIEASYLPALFCIGSNVGIVPLRYRIGRYHRSSTYFAIFHWRCPNLPQSSIQDHTMTAIDLPISHSVMVLFCVVSKWLPSSGYYIFFSHNTTPKKYVKTFQGQRKGFQKNNFGKICELLTHLKISECCRYCTGTAKWVWWYGKSL